MLIPRENADKNAFHPMYGSVDPAPPSDLNEKPSMLIDL
jgi:hypothetical protein